MAAPEATPDFTAAAVEEISEIRPVIRLDQGAPANDGDTWLSKEDLIDDLGNEDETISPPDLNPAAKGSGLASIYEDHYGSGIRPLSRRDMVSLEELIAARKLAAAEKRARQSIPPELEALLRRTGESAKFEAVLKGLKVVPRHEEIQRRHQEAIKIVAISCAVTAMIYSLLALGANWYFPQEAPDQPLDSSSK